MSATHRATHPEVGHRARARPRGSARTAAAQPANTKTMPRMAARRTHASTSRFRKENVGFIGSTHNNRLLRIAATRNVVR